MLLKTVSFFFCMTYCVMTKRPASLKEDIAKRKRPMKLADTSPSLEIKVPIAIPPIPAATCTDIVSTPLKCSVSITTTGVKLFSICNEAKIRSK